MDGTAVIGPEQLLEQLTPVLRITGACKNDESVSMIIERMRESPTFMQKCVYVEVLRATRNQTVLGSFMASGGWTVLNTWLADAKKTSNIALMLELLQLLRKLPVTVELLKAGNAGKVVKQLSKTEHSGELKRLAADLFEDWKSLIKSSTPSNPTKPKGEKRSNSAKNVPEEPAEKKARPDKLFKLGSKEPLVKPKVQESAGFMNALRNSASQPRRIPSKKASTKSASPTQGKAPATVGKTESPTSELLDKHGTNDVEPNGTKLEDCSDSPPPDAEPSGNTEEKRKTKKRKSVSWAPEESLCKVHTFVLDETERTNVHRQSFVDALHSERLRDREVLQSVKMLGGEDVMDETTKWSVPKPLDGVLEVMSPGRESKEAAAQAEREQQVLAFLFLSREILPESPFEPDPELESHPVSQPKVIPLYEPGDEAATAASTVPPAALLEVPTAPTSTTKAVQSLLSTMMNNSPQVASGNASQEARPPQQVYAKAFDPAIQSQISTENLRQILQSTQGPDLGPRPMYPSGPNVPPLIGANYPPPAARPMAPPICGQQRYDAPPRHFQPQPFVRHGPPHSMPYEVRGYRQPQSSPALGQFQPQSSPPHRHYGPPQMPVPPGQFNRYPVDTQFGYPPIHGPSYGQNRTEMQDGAWRR